MPREKKEEGSAQYFWEATLIPQEYLLTKKPDETSDNEAIKGCNHYF